MTAVKAIRRLTVRTVLPPALGPLVELAENLRWSWHPPTRDVFAALDDEVWARVDGNPVRMLAEVSPERLAERAADQGYVDWVHRTRDDLRAYLEREAWFQSRQEAGPRRIAYFSPEFGIAAALPQYSGGLGILAGDHLKAASDLGVPILGVGLFYRSGYFRQTLSREGWQLETYPVTDPQEMPIALLREGSAAASGSADGSVGDPGSPVLVRVGMPGGQVLSAQVWVATVGRVPLLLLDTNIQANDPSLREVTDRLYGGGSDNRLLQEVLLGIGGVRAIREYCRVTGTDAPEVFHSNEGHAGFLGLERMRELITGPAALDFDAALQAVRAGTVFTTHTPVPAGIDRFPREMVARFFGGDNAVPGMPVESILALGQETFEDGDPGVFNMAVMGLRLAQRANGVSLLHGRVSREMFAGLWPGFDPDEVLITSITNGVHAPTWVAREVLELATREVGPELVEEARGWEAIGRIPDHEIWPVKRRLREDLVRMARTRLRDSWLARGAAEAELGWIDGVLDPDILTIGFARRVPSYKRLTLMLRDPDRLRELLLHPERPLQIVVAGKAHPADDGGKGLIQELVRFTDDPEVRHRIAFLPDYDIGMATVLYPGCDVWLNNPIRPLEASGTSGMKAALNGALNLSILDGWWDEWFDGENGWAIPTADNVDDPERRDDLEAASLYNLIERHVAPAFYQRGDDGLPHRWIEMVRHTLEHLGPKVLASRMVGEYVDRLYDPAAQAARAVSSDYFAPARALAAWKSRVQSAWPGVAVEHLEATGVEDVALQGSTADLKAYVRLGALTPDDVLVEVLSGRVDADDRLSSPDRTELKPVEAYDDGRWRYEGSLALMRTGPFGYTVRVLPRHEMLISPVEMGLVAAPVPPSAVGDTPLR